MKLLEVAGLEYQCIKSLWVLEGHDKECYAEADEGRCCGLWCPSVIDLPLAADCLCLFIGQFFPWLLEPTSIAHYFVY